MQHYQYGCHIALFRVLTIVLEFEVPSLLTLVSLSWPCCGSFTEAAHVKARSSWHVTSIKSCCTWREVMNYHARTHSTTHLSFVQIEDGGTTHNTSPSNF
eukprot:2280346-Amphidinium_carterae.1